MPNVVDRSNAAIFTDLYQLTMLQAYHQEGQGGTAVFDLFIRRLGTHRNYLIACGLGDALDYLEALHFSQPSLDYLSTLGLFTDDFLHYLSGFRFTGDVYALAEGTPVFADEPLLEVVAPIGEAQLAETYLLNQITFQTGIASKASRVVHAAQGRAIADFGMRRMHGTDAALKAARACAIVGVASTSNVLAGQLYGLEVTGTMAHSYVQMHADELSAFRAYAQLYPGTTLLVDTYDTLEGVRQVVALAGKLGDDFAVGAIRLDSGDLAALAKDARQILDDAGLTGVRIVASSSLDEHSITELLGQGAPIDAFGVGTRLGTLADRPYLDSVYKLAAYDGEGRMKLAAHKSNLPGRKQVFRQTDGGVTVRDVVARHGEDLDGTPLLEQVMQGGKRTDAGHRTLGELRAHAEEAIGQLPAHLRALDEAKPSCEVVLSDELKAYTEDVRQRLSAMPSLPASP